MSSSKYTRVDPKKVRENAERGGGGSFLKLPDGVECWAPKKADRYSFDVVPYVVSIDNHPDGVKATNVWYKREFQVHFNVGGVRSIVCPGTVGKKCPVCATWQRLKKKYGEKPSKSEEEAIGAVKPKKYVAMNILDPDDPNKRKVFVFNSWNFWSSKKGGLDKELRDPKNEKYFSFFDMVEGRGRTLEVRFDEDSFGAGKFLTATKFEFHRRKNMDEKKTLEASVDLDKALIIPDEEELGKLHGEGEPAGASSSSSSPRGSSSSESRSSESSSVSEAAKASESSSSSSSGPSASSAASGAASGASSSSSSPRGSSSSESSSSESSSVSEAAKSQHSKEEKKPEKQKDEKKDKHGKK